MKNLWNSAQAADFPGDIGQRVYSSRLIGRDPALVLHGGGNTSVKVRARDLFGSEEPILWVKGSGWDLATIEAAGFAPCRMSHLLRLAGLESLTDLQMVSELRGCMTDPSAPTPSVEAILHAVLPAKFVDHTHADAVIAVMNTPGGGDRVREIYGDRVVIVPYVMPGFRLARFCATLLAQELSPDTVGVALMGHGLLTFGDTAESSYGRMIECVDRAERYLAQHGAAAVAPADARPPSQPIRLELADFRRAVSAAMGRPAIVALQADARGQGFARRADVAALSQQGPATPDHALRTKRVPMIGRDLGAYRRDYEAYFHAGAAAADPRPAILDPAPRVILDPEWGLLTAGPSARDASIAADIYGHTIDIILRSTALGGWRALPAGDIFEVEYWDLEQAKLRGGGPPPVFAGEVALVTGAASGIGRACVEAFLRRGAAVVGLDIDPAIRRRPERPEFRGVVCDVTREEAVGAALEEGVRAFGGLDMLVVNAGIFPPGQGIGELPSALWRRVMAVNLDASFVMLRECHPLLKAAPRGGRVAVIGSKNVPAPGPGAAAYSASKAAVNQLARVAALEWGADRIRVNSVHPNMVFDTALWTPEVLESRARHYGLSVEAYKSRNLLGVEVTSRDVAELAAELCGPTFAKTTGAQIPVDGGNERVILKIAGRPYRTIWPGADGASVEIIDQTRLPHEFAVARLASLDDAARAIRAMLVRGAPLIGATAAYGLWLALRADPSDAGLRSAGAVLLATRPTAVNLRWAIERMGAWLEPLAPAARAAAALSRAGEICEEDVAINRGIGAAGFPLLRALAAGKAPGRPVNVLTHCNAGWLATVDVGTATAPIYAAHDAGLPIHVWVDETRPRNQGASLTAWELLNHGVAHTVVSDNAGGHLMQRGEVDLVIVGTDRTTATGDVCNKIGTYLKALAAHDNGVPFYAAVPSPSIDWRLRDGLREIPIENRSAREVTHLSGRLDDGSVATVAIMPEGSAAANPAFDVTPARLVTGLITERGVARASASGLRQLFPAARDRPGDTENPLA